MSPLFSFGARRAVVLSPLFALPLALILATPPAAHAQVVTVTGARTGAAPFTYTFDVFNGTAVDLAAVSFNIPANTALTSLVAPTGFLIAYEPDPALDGSVPGRVDFLEDADALTTQTFGALTTTMGFGFQSLASFGPSSYTALDINGLDYNSNAGITFPGTTVLTQGNIAVPEPGTLALLAFASVPGALFVARRRVAAR